MALALLWAFLLAAVELLETVGMAAARRAGALIVVKVSAAAAVAVASVAVASVAVAAVAVAAVAVVVVVAALVVAAAAAVATAMVDPVDRANAVARCLAARFRWCGPSSCRRPCSARPQ